MTDAGQVRRRRRGLRISTVALIVALGLVLASGGVAFAAWSNERAVSSDVAYASALAKKKTHDEAVAAAARAAIAQAAEEKRIADLKASNDAAASAVGLISSPTDPNVYYKTDSSRTCSTFLPCAWLDVMTTANCPRGVYVSANLVTNGNEVVAAGSKITGALTPNQAAVIEVVFSGTSAGATGYDLTDAHCM